jgi:2-methylisocitrate lyase-like PEP mutase family enzyme
VQAQVARETVRRLRAYADATGADAAWIAARLHIDMARAASFLSSSSALSPNDCKRIADLLDREGA